MTRVAIYVRVSTEEQASSGVSLEAQKESLTSYCKTYQYEIYNIYEDAGKSAKNMRGRPQMMKMLKDAKEGKFDTILIYKLDRFSRSLKDLILTVEQLKKIDIDFISLQDKIETNSASGKLMFHIISSFAEFERDIIGERTRFGMEKKARDGEIVNRAPLGYKIKDKRLVIDHENKDLVKEIFLLYSEHRISLNALAKRYHYTVRGIKKLLMNQTYIGKVKFNENLHKGLHDPIIDKELFEKANRKILACSRN